MGLPLSIAVFVIIWWTVLFAVLPFGVKTQQEAGDVVPGTPGSAPAAPRLLRIVVRTTVVAVMVFALVYAVVAFRLIDPDWFLPPGFGR